MPIHLGQMHTGERGRILGFAQGDKGFRKKLLALGLTAGTELEVLRVAPLGDPVEIRVRGFALSLRREEAAIIRVEGLK